MPTAEGISDATVVSILQHFGMPLEAFAGFRFLRSPKSIFIYHHSLENPTNSNENGGIPFIRIRGKFPKLTSVAAMKFGHLATKNIVTLTPDQLHSLLMTTSLNAMTMFMSWHATSLMFWELDTWTDTALLPALSPRCGVTFTTQSTAISEGPVAWARYESSNKNSGLSTKFFGNSRVTSPFRST